MKKNRILVYGMTSVVGGLERYIINFLQNIDREKFEVDLLVKDKITGEYAKDIDGYYNNMYVFPYAKFFKHPIKTFLYAKKIAQENNYDIVYFNIINAGFSLCALPFKLFSKAKVYIHSHNDYDENKILTHYLFRPIINMIADKRFACSKSASVWMYGRRLTNKKKTFIIRNAIDLNEFKIDKNARKKIRNQLNIDDKFVIGHIGRFCYQKNQEFLIDVFYELQKVEDVILLLIGTGDTEDEIKSKVKSLGISSKVIFLGTTNKVNDYFNAMDLFALPSRFEGLGIVAIEAQAIGLPCLLAQDIPNEAKIIDTTIFIPLEIELWKNKIIEIINNKPNIKSRKTEIIKTGYDLKTEIKRVEKLFLEN